MKNRRKFKSVARHHKPRKSETEDLWLDDETDTDWPDEQAEPFEDATVRCDTKQLRTRHAIEAALEELALKAAMEDFPEYRTLR